MCECVAFFITVHIIIGMSLAVIVIAYIYVLATVNQDFSHFSLCIASPIIKNMIIIAAK